MTCFATCDYSDLYSQYALLVREHSGWSLTDIKALTVRERRFWCETALALINRRM